MPLRVAAISFLNPAPLLYSFEHSPAAGELRERYDVHYTTPAQCARELHAGTADLGLIPVAELTPELSVVPGCTIASRGRVRSILLLVKNPERLPVEAALRSVHRVATDTASRSSVAYVQVLFQHFLHHHPDFLPADADPLEMLAHADAALLIGDPALLARQRQDEIEQAVGQALLWVDVAELWQGYTELPWVAAVWAVRAGALGVGGNANAAELIADLAGSRDAGLAHVEDLVREWTPRIALPAEVIRTYLTENIYYHLDPRCLAAIELFRSLAAEINVLPALLKVPLLRPAEG